MIKPIIIFGKSKFKNKRKKDMRKEFYTKLMLENYIKKQNEDVLYNIKKLMDKKIYLEEKGYDFYCQFQIEVDTIDFEMENNDVIYEIFELNIICTEILMDFKDFDYEKYIENCDNSKISKLFNFKGDFSNVCFDDRVPKIYKELHEVIINYIEKLYDFEKLKEKLPEKQKIKLEVKKI